MKLAADSQKIDIVSEEQAAPCYAGCPSGCGENYAGEPSHHTLVDNNEVSMTEIKGDKR